MRSTMGAEPARMWVEARMLEVVVFQSKVYDQVRHSPGSKSRFRFSQPRSANQCPYVTMER